MHRCVFFLNTSTRFIRLFCSFQCAQLQHWTFKLLFVLLTSGNIKSTYSFTQNLKYECWWENLLVLKIIIPWVILIYISNSIFFFFLSLFFYAHTVKYNGDSIIMLDSRWGFAKLPFSLLITRCAQASAHLDLCGCGF